MRTDRQRNPMMLVPLFAIAAAMVYMLLVQPSLEKLANGRKTLHDLRRQSEAMHTDLRIADSVRRRMDDIEAELGQWRTRQIAPLLESYAMRAKSVVGDLATQAGLQDVEFSDRLPLALPVPQGGPVPPELHSRLPIAISCRGAYAAIVSFIMRVERDLPYVALESLRVVPGGQDPASQRAEIVLEWLVKGGAR